MSTYSEGDRLAVAPAELIVQGSLACAVVYERSYEQVVGGIEVFVWVVVKKHTIPIIMIKN